MQFDSILSMRLILSAFVVMLLSINASEADIYKSVDEDGVICYTDIPLKKNAVRIMRTQTAPVDTKDKVQAKAEIKNKEFHGIVKEKSAKYNVDPSLVHAVIKAESNGNPYAVSKKGAQGLMQLMPTTARDLQVQNPFDPEENIDGGTRYLKYLIEKFNGDLTLALAAYNAGPKTVEKSGSVPQIPETREYVKKVLSFYGGATHYPVESGSPMKERPERIYKLLTDEGTVLFTNLPLNKQYPRF
ncbi:MAG TPA: hypothetical protein DCP92_11625 [Nitrospiraceae bacterium]|nr:hypothetical protein [Nitrospiraceae bacterium]